MGCAYFCGTFLLSAQEMELIHPGQVHLTGNHYVEPAAILEVFAKDQKKSVLQIPLEERRRTIEEIPWVAQATVRRALPNTLQIDITERTPIAFLREGNGMSLIDIHGVILEKPLREDFHFPVVTGIRSDTPSDDREQSMHLFAGFMQGVAAARPTATEQVSEVDLSDLHDLRASLTGLQAGFGDNATYAAADASSPILVHFGDGDFEAKYQTLMEKIGEVRERVGPIDSIDLRFDGELIANPDTVAVEQQPSDKAPAARAPVTKAPLTKGSVVRAGRHSH